MTLYIAIFILLLIAASIEFLSGRSSKLVYVVLFVILTVTLCLRFGIGSDYFGYYYIYLNCEWKGSFLDCAPEYIHGEKGWLFICAICRYLGIRFEVLVAAVGLVDMALLDRFIRLYCPQKMLALLLAYPTLYLTYYFSALRQGLVISFFLAFLLGWQLEKKTGKYIIGAILLSLIHSSALILLVLPVFDLLVLSLRKIIIYTGIAFSLGVFIMATPLHNHIPYAFSGISPMAVTERLLSLLVVLIGASEFYNEEECMGLTKIVNFYALGSMMYFALMSSSLASARLTAALKMLEICIFACVIKLDLKKNMALIFAFLLALTSVTFTKNIEAYIVQCGFPRGTTISDFHYYSVFNKRPIIKLRRRDIYLQFVQNYYPNLLLDESTL